MLLSNDVAHYLPNINVISSTLLLYCIFKIACFFSMSSENRVPSVASTTPTCPAFSFLLLFHTYQ